MSNFLLDSITDVLRSGSLAAVATRLGQSEQQVTRGMQMAVAAIGAGLATKTQDRGFTRQLFDLATTRGVDPARAVADPSTLLAHGAPDSPTSAGSQFVGSVFGNSTAPVTGAIASATGLSPDSTTSLLGMAGTLVLGVLGSRIRSGGMTPNGFADWLAGQRDGLLREAPPAVRGLLGIPAATDASIAAGIAPRPAAGARSDRWLWSAIAAILVLGVVWNVLRGNRAAVETQAAAGTASDTSAGEIAATAVIVRRLPNGVALRIPNNGTEIKLLSYLDDPTRTGKDTTWFDFDRLLFETNSSTLAPSSQDQLHDVGMILMAYPKAHATIGGYTDSTGDADANVRLSQDRAGSVVTELVAVGVPANQLTAKGYGAAHPVADNGTAVGRAQNRRIAIRVTDK
jgi:OmpA-OmpF porin, OOP family